MANHQDNHEENHFGAQVPFLYHFGFGSGTVDFSAAFGDVKYVCCGGSANRAAAYSKKFASDNGFPEPENISLTDRYVLYKTGPVLWPNHGMGTASISIMLIEILKLCRLANAEDVTFIRLGTSGGVGIEPGTVIISSEALDGELLPQFIQHINGKRIVRSTRLDEGLSKDLLAIAKQEDIPAVRGKTLCANDFYEGQMRLDGYFCDYVEKDKLNFLRMLNDNGVKNIEMESTAFASYTSRAGFKAAIVCVALLNRMEGDSIKLSVDNSRIFEERPFQLVSALIRSQLNL